MAIRNVTDCKGPVLWLYSKEGYWLSGDSTVAIREVTDC